MFGKPFSAYVRFAGLSLAIIAGVALLRLVLGMAGLSPSFGKILSVTYVLLLCALVWSARVHTTGFGSYKQILPVVWLQAATASIVIMAAIALAIFTGQDNIYTVPEFTRGAPGRNWGHVAGHLIFGCVIGPLFLWALGSLVMLVTKTVSRGPTAQRPAA